VRLGSNLALVYLCINLVDSRQKVMQIFRVLTVSTLIVALYGFYQWMIQDYGALFWIVNPRLDTSLAHYRDYFWEWRHRIISVLTSEMELGHYFNLCIPISVVLWLTEGRKQLASKWFLITCCLLLGLILTFTFGSWLALAGACGFSVLFFGGRKKARLLIYSTLALIAITLVLAYSPLEKVIEDKVSGNAIGSLAWDAATRLYGWKLALQAWWSHPLLGVGIGNFEFFSADYDFVLGAQSLGSSPHETFLYLLANYGLIGTAAVVFIIASSIRSGIQVARTHSRYALIAGALSFAIAANLIGWLSDDSTYLGPHTSYLLWLFVGLVEAVRNLQAKDESLALAAA
jgi:putative inorganic carbon (HCO3(-)) transporter